MEVPDYGELHTLSFDPTGAVVALGGYEDYEKKNWLCLQAEGDRYQKYGITTGSTLLCSADVTAKQGDLVVAGQDGEYMLYIFNTDPGFVPEDQARVLNDKSAVRAVVLASFRFFK